MKFRESWESAKALPAEIGRQARVLMGLMFASIFLTVLTLFATVRHAH